MTELIKEFPALWALLGMVFSSVVFMISSRKIFVLQGVASENLSRTLNRQMEALETERGYYRDKLHAERDSHQECQLKVKELEQRPDLSGLKELLTSQQSWMKQLGESLKQIDLSMSKIPGQLDRLSIGFDERQEKMLAQFNFRK